MQKIPPALYAVGIVKFTQRVDHSTALTCVLVIWRISCYLAALIHSEIYVFKVIVPQEW